MFVFFHAARIYDVPLKTGLIQLKNQLLDDFPLIVPLVKIKIQKCRSRIEWGNDPPVGMKASVSCLLFE